MRPRVWGYLQNYFQNFEPSSSFRLYADAIVYKLQEVAPDGSTVISMVRKIGSFYSSRIDIISKLGHLKTLGSAFDAQESLDVARQRMISELERFDACPWPA
jgi:hypothetical protein